MSDPASSQKALPHPPEGFFVFFGARRRRVGGLGPHFVREGCSGTSQIANLLQFLPIDPHFVRKGCSRTSQIAILPQFSPIDPHFVRKGWRFVTHRRYHLRPKEREIKKARQRKRREKGEKMWRWEDVWEDVWEGVKMSRCEDEQMWEKMWEKMWRWADVREDVKMSRCEDEQMWRWEGVKMRRWNTDPHYWKNPPLRRSREKRSNSVRPTWHKQHTKLYSGFGDKSYNVFNDRYYTILDLSTASTASCVALIMWCQQFLQTPAPLLQ